MANFDKLLEASTNEIKKSIQDKYNKTLDETKLKHFDSEEYNILDAKVSMLLEKKNEFDKLMREAMSDRDNIITPMSFEGKEWNEANGYHVNRNSSEATYLARKELHDDPIYTNIEQFRLLSNKYINAMNIAVGTKEKRNILMSFYKLDWKGLGISVPPEMNFSDVKVENGKIISDTSKLLSN